MCWQTAPGIKHASQVNLSALVVELTLLEDARALSQLQAVQCKYVVGIQSVHRQEVAPGRPFRAARRQPNPANDWLRITTLNHPHPTTARFIINIVILAQAVIDRWMGQPEQHIDSGFYEWLGCSIMSKSASLDGAKKPASSAFILQPSVSPFHSHAHSKPRPHPL